MSRAEVSKLVEYVAIGPPDATASVPKLVMYVLLEPGASDDSPRQAHVFSQKIRRR